MSLNVDSDVESEGDADNLKVGDEQLRGALYFNSLKRSKLQLTNGNTVIASHLCDAVSSPQGFIDAVTDARWLDWADWKCQHESFHIVNVSARSCTCYYGSKQYVCKHLLGPLIEQNAIDLPPHLDGEPLRQARKKRRGRPPAIPSLYGP